MKNITYILGIVFALWGWGNSSHADTKIGIGTGYTSGFPYFAGGNITLPIILDSYLLIEPFIGYMKDGEDVDRNLPDYSINEREAYQAGVSLFRIRKLNEDFELYYGASFGASKSKYNYENKNTFDSGTSVSESFSQRETDSTAFLFKPTFGASYLISDDFTVSVDVGIYYSWGEEDRKEIRDSTSSGYEESESTVDIDHTSTASQLIFRMIF
jgi:hypothetical protein